MLDRIDEIASDLSVYHRIDDAEGMDMGLFAARVSVLPAYGGALAQRVQRDQQDAPIHPSPVRPSPVYAVEQPANGDTSPEEVERMWHGVLAQQFPDHISGGIQRVSDDEMAKLVNG